MNQPQMLSLTTSQQRPWSTSTNKAVDLLKVLNNQLIDSRHLLAKQMCRDNQDVIGDKTVRNDKGDFLLYVEAKKKPHGCCTLSNF